MQENWYILYALVAKQEQLCSVLCRHGLRAFVPMMEYYRRDIKGIAVKPMFPGYLFVRSDMCQQEFDTMLFELGDEKQGMVRQLKEEGTAAMREEEIDFFAHLLDEQGVARMSYGYRKGSRGVVTEGPLAYFQERIVKADRHNRLAWLDFEFMNRRIQAGLTIDQSRMPEPEKGQEEKETTLTDGTMIDLEELKSKMMGL